MDVKDSAARERILNGGTFNSHEWETVATAGNTQGGKRGMVLLAVEESREIPLRNVAQEGEEMESANKVDTDSEGEPRNSPQRRKRRKRPQGR
ncbi:hypothetical protein AXG93_2909s1000 [Marchantia polymorpha subsp. ruderalis]|uniref:Uncharacterized protein n=1 Tax=Marchantia polymorpha subsp. ruderalis TaxID=1480154 RepID=A0A176WBS2_MARPO|nr:hypothetical protein AXG93_2909s1000 [Marchantia polymorpha subsp. ruderalis]